MQPSAELRIGKQESRWRMRNLMLVVASALVSSLMAIAFLRPIVRKWSWIAPLDDAYIHFQYAWNLGRGHLFRFHPGDPYSTGETSPLYAVLLAPFAAVRVSRIALVAIAQLSGVVLLAATLALTARACRRMTGTSRGEWATLVIMVAHGFFLWLFFSGMETGLYLCILALLLDALAGWDAGPAPPSLIAAA